MSSQTRYSYSDDPITESFHEHSIPTKSDSLKGSSHDDTMIVNDNEHFVPLSLNMKKMCLDDMKMDSGFIEGSDYLQQDDHVVSEIDETAETAPTDSASSKQPILIRRKAVEYQDTFYQQSGQRKHRINRDLFLATLNPETSRKCALADYYFLNYYYGLLKYLNDRKERTASFRQSSQSLSQDRQQKEWKRFCTKESDLLRRRRLRITLEHFQPLAQIGQGGYGEVFLVKHVDSGEICAMKKMNKRLLRKMNEVQHILTERDVLTQTRSPWLVKLLYSFQTTDHIYLAMEYIPGGDMRTLLNKCGVMKEQCGKFYCAEMFIAVSELHSLGYIHRDLKPENFLIDKQGHLKLTDFGLSKGHFSQVRMESLREKLVKIQNLRVISDRISSQSVNVRDRKAHTERAFTLVGSPDYMAPEVLTHGCHNARHGMYAPGYDYLCDYWSLGVMLFEMLTGYPPFSAQTNDEVWFNLYHWEEILVRPVYEGDDKEFNLSDESWDLISSLITHRHLRLGDIQKIQEHPWFMDFNSKIQSYLESSSTERSEDKLLWHHLRHVPATEISPPFVPKLATELDHKYFDDFSDPSSLNNYKEVKEKQQRMNDDLDETDRRNERDMALQSRIYRAPYIGFTYRHNM